VCACVCCGSKNFSVFLLAEEVVNLLARTVFVSLLGSSADLRLG
jgi:hypothetical protein